MQDAITAWNTRTPSTDASNALLRESMMQALEHVWKSGHSEGWRGNQLCRDVQHVDAQVSWGILVRNRAIEKVMERFLAIPATAQQSDKPTTEGNAALVEGGYKPEEIEFLQCLLDRYSEDGGTIDLSMDHPAFMRIVRKHAPILTALSTPQPDTAGLVEGPQPVKAPDRMTCTGCPHLTTEWWREYLPEDDEYDSGTAANCAAAEGRSITAYWSDNNSPPSWCPFLTALRGQHPDKQESE